MRLVFANNYYYLRGGAEKVFFGEIDLFSSNSHETAPFSRDHENNYASKYSGYFAPNLKYEDISILKKVPAGISLVYSLETKKYFSRLISEFEPDLVHAHNIYGRLTSSIVDAAKEKKVPMVMTLHDYKLICPSYLMTLKGENCELCINKRFYSCLANRCHKDSLMSSLIYTFESYFTHLLKKYDHVKYFICPSRFLLNKHLEAGFPREKLVHVPHFTQTDNVEPDFNSGKYILYVGRLSKEKGVLTLIKAAKELSVPLKIVGEGPMGREYKKYVKDNNINNIQFEGHRSSTELLEIYRNAAFTVVPSEWHEVFGLIIIESFACGKPVIASRTGGIPELVKDHETGLLFRPGDHMELREKIAYLYSKPDLTAKLGRNARNKAESEYSADIQYRNLLELYAKAMA